MLTSVPFPPACGIGNYVSNLSDKLTRRGHEVVIITRGGPKWQVTTYDNLVVYKLPFIMAYPFHVDIHGLFVNRFLKTIAQDIDLVHVHTPLPPAIITQLPIVTTFHTPHFADFYSTDLVNIRQALIRFLAIFDYRIEKSLIHSSNILSSVSEGVKIDLERYYQTNPRQIRVFGNAVSDRFLNSANSLSIEKDDLKILYVGRFDYRKGLLDLVESMKIVTRSVAGARLVLVGEGSLLPQVIRRIKELDLQKQVEIKGFVSREEVIAHYLSASIFVLPSHYEGLATTSLEAMACKAAVVATNVRGNSDVIKSGYTGLLVPKKEPCTLGNAIVHLLKHPKLREELAKNARKLVEENFTWEKVTDRVLEAYLAATK